MQCVTLPSTMDEVWRQIYLSYKKSSVGSHTQPRKTNKVRSYTEGALLTGRPLASTLIIICGKTGAGKSSLLNMLFGDSELCPTNRFTSETKNPVLLQKSLNITSLNPPIAGKLSFLDLPGTFDTDIERDLKHTQMTRSFLNKLEELKSRPGINLAISGASCMVYPNIVMLVLKASDNRILGNNTSLRKSLDQIKQTGKMVDPKRSNLIIVLTHACTLGLNQDLFEKDAREKKDQISKVVYEVLGITDLSIVLVENEPERYNLKKSGDFYVLPNKELSHYNLIETMLERFDKNHDLIGRLNVGWYLNPKCPEKGQPIEIIRDTNVNIDSVINLTRLQIESLYKTKVQGHNIYSIKQLGFGYTPVYEECKYLCAVQYSTQKEYLNLKQFGNKLFRFYDGINVDSIQQKVEDRISYLTKKDYEDKMQNIYEMEPEMNLLVRTTNNQLNWMMTDSNNIQYKYLCDISVATLSVKTQSLCQLNSNLQEHLKNIPTEYNGSSAIKFMQFFDKWGSHFVHNIQIGGQITVQLTAKNSELLQHTPTYLLDTSRKTLRNFCFGKINKCSLLSDLQKLKVSEAIFTLKGGQIPVQMDLNNVTYENLKKWMTSISDEPLELPSSIKLFPYYKIIHETSKRALRLATLDYLSGKFAATGLKVPLYRRDIAKGAVNQASILASQAKPLSITIDV